MNDRFALETLPGEVASEKSCFVENLKYLFLIAVAHKMSTLRIYATEPLPGKKS